MAKTNLPSQYVSEATEYNSLYMLGVDRTSTGNPSFYSHSSGVTYSVTDNTGQDGLLVILKAVIQDYYIFASDFNSKVSIADLTSFQWTWGDLYNP